MILKKLSNNNLLSPFRKRHNHKPFDIYKYVGIIKICSRNKSVGMFIYFSQKHLT